LLGPSSPTRRSSDLEPDPAPEPEPDPEPEPEPDPEPIAEPDPEPTAAPAAQPTPAPTPAATPEPLPAFAVSRASVSATRLVRPTRPVVFRVDVTLPARVRIRLERRAGARWVPAGELVRAAVAGENHYPFAGRIAGRALRRGLYRFRVSAIDAAGRAAGAAGGRYLRVTRTRARR
jgi:hypothetical protein